VPGEVELAQRLVGQARNAEARQDALEVAAVQDVEPGERDAPLLHLGHGRLVFAAPGVREGGPIEIVAEGFQDALALAGDAAAPIDEGAEHVEEQRFDAAHAVSVRPRPSRHHRLLAHVARLPLAMALYRSRR
jgi:hypothetical protein